MKYNKSKSNKTNKYKKSNKTNKSRKTRKNKTHKRKNVRKGGFGWFGPAVASSAILSQNKPGSQQRSITNTNPTSWTPKVASSGWRGPPRLPPNAIPHVSFSENPRKPEKPENSDNSWKTYEELTPEEQEQEFRENASGMADFDNPLTRLRTLEGYRDRAATLEEARKKYEMSPYTVGYIDSSKT